MNDPIARRANLAVAWFEYQQLITFRNQAACKQQMTQQALKTAASEFDLTHPAIIHKSPAKPKAKTKLFQRVFGR